MAAAGRGPPGSAGEQAADPGVVLADSLASGHPAARTLASINSGGAPARPDRRTSPRRPADNYASETARGRGINRQNPWRFGLRTNGGTAWKQPGFWLLSAW